MSNVQLQVHPLGRLLSRASRLLDTRIIEDFSDHDMGPGQLYSLLALYDEEGLCQRDICETYGLDKAAVGRALKKLEDKDFVERRSDPEDRRIKRVYLSEKAKSFRSECFDRLKTIEEDLMDVLTPHEENIFRRVIQKMCEALECDSGEDKGGISGNESNTRSSEGNK